VSEILISWFPEFPVLRLIISHAPGGEAKVLSNEFERLSPHEKEIVSTPCTYFSDRTGPDFMHPIYTLGFIPWCDKICPSVAANANFSIAKNTFQTHI
jgi:hypothetical protein